MKNITSKLILFLTLLCVGGFAVDARAAESPINCANLLTAQYNVLTDTIASVNNLDNSGANAEKRTNLLNRLEIAKINTDINCLSVAIDAADTKEELDQAFILYSKIRPSLQTFLNNDVKYSSELRVAVAQRMYNAASKFNKSIGEISCTNIPANATSATDQNPRTYTATVNFAFLNNGLTQDQYIAKFKTDFSSAEFLDYPITNSVYTDQPVSACQFTCPLNSTYKIIDNVNTCELNYCTGKPSNTAGMHMGPDTYTRTNPPTTVPWTNTSYNYDPSTAPLVNASRVIDMRLGAQSDVYYTSGFGLYGGNMAESTNPTQTSGTTAVQTLLTPIASMAQTTASGINYIRFNDEVDDNDFKRVQGIETIFETLRSGYGPLRVGLHNEVQFQADESINFWYRPDQDYVPTKNRSFGLFWNYQGWSRRIHVVYTPPGETGCFTDAVGFYFRFIMGSLDNSSDAFATSECFRVTDDFHMISYAADRAGTNNDGRVTFRFYVDGKEISTPNNTIPAGLFPIVEDYSVRPDEFHIGKSVGSTPAQHYFGKGDIAEFSFFNGTALPAADILSRYSRHVLQTAPIVPTLNACQFTCAENFTWDATQNRCVGAQRAASCGTLPAHAHIFTPQNLSTYVQEFNGTNWVQASSNIEDKTVWTRTTNATPNECRYTCSVDTNGDCKNPVISNPKVNNRSVFFADAVRGTTIETAALNSVCQNNGFASYDNIYSSQSGTTANNGGWATSNYYTYIGTNWLQPASGVAGYRLMSITCK